jgi:hypothetical protein
MNAPMLRGIRSEGCGWFKPENRIVCAPDADCVWKLTHWRTAATKLRYLLLIWVDLLLRGNSLVFANGKNTYFQGDSGRS